MHDSLVNNIRNIISGNQHSFLRCRSTVSNLAHYLHSIFESINKTNSVYLDFNNAFESVCHPLLIHKRKSYGYFEQRIGLQWLLSNLLNRTQYVALEGKASDWKPLFSGAPQGSQIGPLLFIFYINDLTNHVDSCKISLYAADSKLFR